MAIVSNVLNKRLLGAARLLSCLLVAVVSAALAAEDDVLLTVHRGDTLIGISQRYLDRTDRWSELKRLNSVGDEFHLVPGSRLRLPARWLRWSAAAAEVVHVQGTVRGPGGPLAAGVRLAPGDAIDTGADGILTLRLGDGATAVFPAGSRARLGKALHVKGTPLHDTAILIEAGSAESRVPNLKETGSRFELNTPRVVTAVRGTRFRVAAEGEASRHEVLAGVVRVAGHRGRVASLTPGQGLVAEAGRVGKVTPLLPPPVLDAIPAPIERTLLRLKAASQVGAVAWRWQVAADADFTQVLRDQRTQDPVWMLAAPADGDYHLRVSAIDGQGLQGRETVQAIAIRARPEPPLMMTPTPGGPAFGRPQMSWTAAQDAASTHLQVARDAAFTQLVVDRPDLSGNRHAAEGEWPVGDYHWRLASRHADGHRGPFGDPARFSVQPPTAMAAPDVDGDVLRLRWSGPADLSYRLQVATDAEFAQIEHEAVVRGTSAELPAPKGGSHYVRTQPVMPDGSGAPWSATQRFEAPGGGPWWLLLVILPLL